MENDGPLVSIIIPMYNAEKYLAETLDSIVAQSYKTWECFLMDDGSSDGTAELAKKYCVDDSRFRYYRQENAGPSVARNNGLKRASGDYIQFIDSDDVMLPSRFEKLLSHYKKCDVNTVLFSKMEIGLHDDILNTSPANRGFGNGQALDFNRIYGKYGIDFLFVPGTVLFPISAVKNIQWNEDLSFSEDFEYYLAVSFQGFSFINYPEVLTIYRDSPKSLSKQSNHTAGANYDIYSRWVTDRNQKVYSQRCALQFHRNILLYFRGKRKRLVWPKSSTPTSGGPTLFARVMVYPYTIGYLVKAVFKF